MKTNRTRKWLIGLGIAGGLLVVLTVIGVAGWQLLVSWFMRQYYQETYLPQELTAASLGAYPAAHHLQDVPWIATRETYCQSNSLAMIAAQHGMEVTSSQSGFLMGFTYGATEIPGVVGLNPFTDPEAGFVVAAPYLGLERRYYTTDDQALYLSALRYYLSRGYAVRVALDVAVLYDLEDQLPHSDLLVGYDEAGFYYYETVCLPGFPCEPRHSPPGEKGLWVSDQKLIDAVLSQAKQFAYPWRYSLMIFETGPLQDDLKPIWTRNGQLLNGGAPYGPRQGVDAIEKLAAALEERGTRVDTAEVRWGLEAAVFSRRDNAVYLRTAFPQQTDIEHAADLFDQAAEAYHQALALLEDGIAEQAEAGQIAIWLEAADAEREVGEIFMARGR